MTAMDFDGQKREKAIYFGSLKKMLVKPKNAVFAARGQASKKLLGNSVTVARLTLDQLVQVRILVPQVLLADTIGVAIIPVFQKTMLSVYLCQSQCIV